MPVFKRINASDFSVVSSKVHKTQELTSGSDGINATQFRSGSNLGSSGSYWDSLHSLFYQSGSTHRSSEATKYSKKVYSLAENRIQNPTFLNKFYKSGSIISIPQQYFGERIKPKTFQLTDDSSAKQIIIKDDGYGNLYSSNAHHSQSAATSISSSDNYVGNIFYDFGIAALTETGSWSGSINYTDATVGNYTLKFDTTQTFYTREYSITIDPSEFNRTMNTTVRAFVSGGAAISRNRLHSSTPYLANQFTGSGWSAYFNQIQLYNDTTKEPLILANLPRPIKTSDKLSLTLKIRLDI